MFARGDLFSSPSSPGRRRLLDDGIMRVTDVCDWRGARANVRIRRCGRELLGYIMVISPYGDQTLPHASVGAMVSLARVVASRVFPKLSCEQLSTLWCSNHNTTYFFLELTRWFAPLPPEPADAAVESSSCRWFAGFFFSCLASS